MKIQLEKAALKVVNEVLEKLEKATYITPAEREQYVNAFSKKEESNYYRRQLSSLEALVTSEARSKFSGNLGERAVQGRPGSTVRSEELKELRLELARITVIIDRSIGLARLDEEGHHRTHGGPGPNL